MPEVGLGPSRQGGRDQQHQQQRQRAHQNLSKDSTALAQPVAQPLCQLGAINLFISKNFFTLKSQFFETNHFSLSL
jgi:hypothetical protein